MGTTLNPGNMQAAVDPNNNVPTDFESSMAASIEAALNELLQLDSMNTFQVATNSKVARDRRRLLIAIAQGVISHLSNNAGAFQITGTDSVGGPISVSFSINTTNVLTGI